MTRSSLAWLFLALMLVSPFNLAQQTAKASDLLGTKGKAGTNYASFGFALNEFRSVELILVEAFDGTDGSYAEQSIPGGRFFPETAQTYGMFGTIGTYISDYVRTELRLGTGIKSDTIREALEVNMHYWYAWYMGAVYPLTDYMSVYGQYGVALYDAHVTRKETRITLGQNSGRLPVTYTARPSRWQMEEELFGTKFSTSWLVGAEFDLIKGWRLAVDYGRLLRDTDTNIKVYQGNVHFRFEF